MEDVDSIDLHQFENEVLVEIVGTDTEKRVMTRSVAFHFRSGSNEEVLPQEELPANLEREIRETLTEHGYELVHS